MEFLTENELAGLEKSGWAVQRRAAAEIREWRRKDAELKIQRPITRNDPARGNIHTTMPEISGRNPKIG